MDAVSRDTQISLAAWAMFPGFRFSPTDEELISYYLTKKLQGLDKCVEVIAEVDFCKYEPWDLPAKSIITSDNEWFFFSARGRKYPNGSQSRRATELGYWKATGKERNVKSGTNVIGTKRTLVFHIGRAPKGERTEWIMHEYCLAGQSQDSMVVCRLRRNADFRPNENVNRACLGGTTTNDNNNAIPDTSIDQTGISRGDKAVESSWKNSSSSDSHSIGHPASESDQKHQAESSSRQKDLGDEEDCYADILKDDIIKLDDSAPFDSLDLMSMIVNRSDIEKTCQQQLEPKVASQGTAYRRIRLRKLDPENSVETRECSESVESPKCLGMSRFTASSRLISIVLIFLTLVALVMSLLQAFGQFKRNIEYADLYNEFQTVND